MAVSVSGYAAAFPIYRTCGWSPIKLAAATKGPPPTGFTGHDGREPSYADMHAWAEQEPDGNLALRLPPDLIGIDVDHYGDKNGGATIAEAQKRWGRLPYSPRSTSRDDSASGIRLYRIPAGVRLVDGIKFPELGLGGIDIIQSHHRYVLAWPSIHNSSGATYRWLGIDGGPLDAPPTLEEIPALPDTWLEALQEPQRNNVGNDGPAMGAEMTYKVRDALTEGEPSRRVAWKLGEAIIACDGQNRHDDTRDNVLALLRYGKQGDTGVAAALTALEKAFVAAVADSRAGGRDEAKAEYRKFINGERTGRLLADPDYDDDAQDDGGGEQSDELTTWEPIDLGPWLAGDLKSPQPTVGISRSDGQKLLYAGREHTVFGETEAGKSWFALECCAVEIRMGRDVVYIHYEESDPASTIERLRLLAVTPAQIAKHLRFAAPLRPARPGWLTALLNPAPALVVHDGINEAMSLHGDDTNAADGTATFRRTIIKPCLAVGAATLSCDHVTKSGGDNRGRYAMGSAHKVNAIDGAAFLMENIEPFGRGLRGASSVYVTKDRPGQLRAHGRPTGLPGKTLVGVLTVDASKESEDFLVFWPPKSDDGVQGDGAKDKGGSLAEISDLIYGIVAAEPDGSVKSRRDLFAKMRNARNMFRDDAMRDAADMLVAAGRLIEVAGKRGATGYKAVATASQTPSKENSSSTVSATASRTASPIEGDAVGRSRNASGSHC